MMKRLRGYLPAIVLAVWSVSTSFGGDAVPMWLAFMGLSVIAMFRELQERYRDE